MTSFLWPPGSTGVFSLFLIPLGPGIPGGVLLARSHGLGWPRMEALYFVSDVILACVFEPMMRGIIRAGRNSPRFGRVAAAMRESLRKTSELYGRSGGPLTLILIAFGVDPMTGRAAAHTAGHGFVAGWTFAIAGDMMFFTVLMASTLWLNSILGDGKVTTIVIMVLMIAVPWLIKRWKQRGARPG